MLVLDTSAQQNWQQAAKVESSAALRQKALIDELQSNSISVGDDAGRDTGSLLAQMGRPLASQEVQRRLHLCNPKLIFERSAAYPELTGVYIEKDERLPTGGWQKRKVHLLGMESGIMPEFSVLHKTTKQVANPELFGKEKPQRDIDWVNVPTFASETRGWRTVLVRLLHLGLIVQMDVEKYFDWTPSQQSEKWYNMTR